MAWKPTITTDCGSNISAAIDNLSTGAFWMKCALHIIHNSVMAGFASNFGFKYNI